MWNNLLRSIGKPEDDEDEIAKAAKVPMPKTPKVPSPTKPNNRETWAQAAALKKLRGF